MMTGFKPHHLAIIAEWQDGMSLREFAAKHGYSREGIALVLRRAGITLPTASESAKRMWARDPDRRARHGDLVRRALARRHPTPDQPGEQRG